MRPHHAAVLILLLLGVLLASVPPASGAPTPGYTAKVARTVWITPYYTQVKDTVLINNTSAATVSYVDFKIPTREYNNLFAMSAIDNTGHNLQLTLQGTPLKNFTFYRVPLAKPVPVNQTSSLTINRYLLFFGSSFSQTAANVSLTLFISPTILLLSPIFKANFTAFLPSRTNSFDFSPSSYNLSRVTFKFTKNTSASTINGNLTEVPQPDSLQPISITFTGDSGTAKGTNNIYVASALTTINLGDTLTASTTFTVYNARGGTDIGRTTTVTFTMPSILQDPITASDFTGDLNPAVARGSSANSPVNVTVPFRYDLARNQTYALTLNYQLKPDNILTKTGDTYTVNLTSISPYIPFILNLQVRLVTPYGSSALKLIPTPQSLRTPSVQGNEGGSDFVEFDMVNSSALFAQNLPVSFNYAWYWGFIKPWFYGNFIYLIGLVFVAVYLREKPVKAPIAPGIVEDLKRFCDLYDDKTALGLEVHGLEDSLRRGKIAKPLFDKRLLEIDARRTNLDRQLGELSRSIRQSAPRYVKSIDQIELLEAELRTVNATVKDLQRQYAARRVSRRVYDDLMYTYEGRLRKIQGRIDSLIINLREGR